VEFEKAMSEFRTELYLRSDLYHAILQYKMEAEENGSFEKLDPESQRYVKEQIKEMEKYGLKLSKDRK